MLLHATSKTNANILDSLIKEIKEKGYEIKSIDDFEWKEKTMKKKHIRRIDQMLEIPKEVYSDEPKFTITGFEEVVIENYKGILEYEDFFVRISTYIGIVNINGYNLNLETMTNDDIKVKGKIESIDVERLIE